MKRARNACLTLWLDIFMSCLCCRKSRIRKGSIWMTWVVPLVYCYTVQLPDQRTPVPLLLQKYVKRWLQIFLVCQANEKLRRGLQGLFRVCSKHMHGQCKNNNNYTVMLKLLCNIELVLHNLMGVLVYIYNMLHYSMYSLFFIQWLPNNI